MRIPTDDRAPQWEIVVDTAGETANSEPRASGATIVVQSKSIVVLRAHEHEPAPVDNSVAASLSVLTNSTADSPVPSSPDTSS